MFSNPASLLQRLKLETRPHHERAEQAVRLMEPALTPAGYRRHLEALWGLHAPLEERLAERLTGSMPELRIGERRKAALLEVDLRALGHDAASLACLPRAAGLPPLPGVPEALGCCYVLEGSTLGGQVLLRHLSRHFEGVPVGPFAFFRAYGEQTGPMWRAFGEALTRASSEAASEVFDGRVIQGAQETFEAFVAWLSQEASDAPVRL
ncbi:Bacteriophytochrome heme oxygenase BphO [Stigmatella aurantiaca DW4/3-1]|uniref:Bacteriophytochrome heme oxygenase BphO n=1 Tax=Stigmatella aurantiaca (strain DW4/3-1) TaxID=378806 RepID=E3FW42_STIAD|nr:biliverdin-producing heme oxygenase [Stigmatella aurantiaca]ADO74763.1 Bacteriophytochrome heme oxygenase BphO [Stigmatella aurantiaca DW4/3-1]